MNSIQDNVRKLLSENDLRICPEATNIDLSCVKCRKIMLDPFQTYCCCQYCRGCIIDHLANGDQYCCGTKADCKIEILDFEGNVTRNAMLNNKILNVKFFCPNELCTHSSKLSEMTEHLRVCNKQPIECPFSSIGCDIPLEHNDSLLVHQQDNIFKHNQLLTDLMRNLKNDVNSNKTEILSLKNEIKNKDAKIAGLEGHSRTQDNKIAKVEGDLTLIKLQNEEIVRESKIQTKEISELKCSLKNEQTKVAALERDANDKNNKMAILQRDSNDRLNEIRTLQCANNGNNALGNAELHKRTDDVCKQIENGLHRINELEYAMETLNTGTNTRVAIGMTIFTVDNFELLKVPNECILSPYFYSHTNGYKLRLRIYPGGDSDGAGTHLSVYIVLCKGEYDDILPWPCKHQIKVSIINQINGETHYSHTFDYFTAEDDCKYVFFKPSDLDNNGYGRVKFISHEDLGIIAGLILNKSVAIRCVVTMPL